MRTLWIPIVSSIIFIGMFVVGPALHLGESYSGVYTWEAPVMMFLMLGGTWLLGFISCLEVLTGDKDKTFRYKIRIGLDSGKTIVVNTSNNDDLNKIKRQMNNNKNVIVNMGGHVTKIDKNKITFVDYHIIEK